ncbi:Ubiquitin family protein [Trichomonas vaginalis G3]|uniref:UV excision repair protein RAD23 n=1 Tax=Trichomonas vaginalis (strain ATCC PRA-98 / G3) TaxID=412133 RepID=A2FIG9_TRIV3|nr:UV excision repair protein RAD23 family [Trichomonas vaginalis G3]EAX95286.1 Ubiquitin family protein [Trichomonas vaginalis G3]KAI5539343.1 UV excision repair protein RAD23 family [Trichomonas vaginalis G3]|eukprot:XP_001308216.1 Ubiquitin family protein [Trichomonas vaginalis G3]
MTRQLSIRSVKGNIYKIDVPEDATVGQAKEIFREQCDPEAKDITFIFKANRLDNSKLISSLDIKKTDFFIVHIVKKPAAPKPAEPAPAAVAPAPAPAPQTPAPAVPRAAPLPELVQPTQQNQFDMDALVSSPQFVTAVNSLEELGFKEEEATAALKAAKGNAELAYNFLEQGYIPSEQDIENQQNLINQLREKLTAEPSLIPQYILAIAAQHPDRAQQYMANPEQFLNDYGLDPNKFDIPQIKEQLNAASQEIENLAASGDFADAPDSFPQQEMNPMQARLSSYSPEEQEVLKRIFEIFPNQDQFTVIQVYEACGKDENQTVNCLLSMM